MLEGFKYYCFVLVFIHFAHYSPVDVFFYHYLPINYLREHLVYFQVTSHRVIFFDQDFHQVLNCYLYSILNVLKLLITLISKYLPKEFDFMVALELLDSMYNSRSPFNYELLKSIFLFQIIIHKRFHCPGRLLQLMRFLVLFNLLRVNFLNHFFQLFQCQLT